jgi:alpha,alpha-trehalase
MRALRGVRAALPALLILLPAASTQCKEAPRTELAHPAPPQVLLKDLFVAVQTAGLFPDGKTFADALPKTAPAQILREYRAEHPTSKEALRQFVAAHFEIPGEVTSVPSSPDRVSIVTHIDQLWDQLTRRTPTAPPYSSMLPLPQPYVVPGGRFRELYYWDSYFTMLGLAESGRQDLLTDMVRDFAYLIDAYGHVPNGTRTYYLSRSQPPFFFAMVGLLAKDGSDPGAAYAEYLPQLRKEHAFWMQGAKGLHSGSAHRHVVAMADGSILNRYWDDRDTPRDEAYGADTELARRSERPARQVYRDIRAAAESGWDFGSRWFADEHNRFSIDTTEIVPVDLNSLLFGLENAIQAGCEHRGDADCAREFARLAAARRSAMDRYLWNESRGTYFDYRWTQSTPITRVSAATVYPLFFGVASKAQAAAVAKVVSGELLREGGIVTTPLNTGEQWDAPNGWAPLQWIAVGGLRRYELGTLAEAVACRWMVNVNGVYNQSGKLVEKYDVVTTGRSGGGGEYPLQDGFGWTNGVMRKLIALYPQDATYSTATQCPKS